MFHILLVLNFNDKFYVKDLFNLHKYYKYSYYRSFPINNWREALYILNSIFNSSDSEIKIKIDGLELKYTIDSNIPNDIKQCKENVQKLIEKNKNKYTVKFRYLKDSPKIT